MFKPFLFVVALAAAMVAMPAIAEPGPSRTSVNAPVKKAKTPPPARKPASDRSGMIPAAVLLSGVVLVTLANRRRSLQKVLD